MKCSTGATNMKTPEQLAEEYATPRFETYDETKGYQKAQRNAFLAGYQAAKEHAHAALEEAEARIQELRDQLMEESGGRLRLFKDEADAKAAYQEAWEDADTCEHILDMEKMVDVSSSATLNNWISVKDRLPEIPENDYSNRVLLLRADGFIIIARIEKCVRFVRPLQQALIVETDNGDPIEEFTHWMPLPEPPKEEG
jgi:hypothetical protein